MSSVKGHLGPNEYVVKNNVSFPRRRVWAYGQRVGIFAYLTLFCAQKIGFFHKLSMYWDDEPPILLAETDLLRGNFRKLSPDKLQTRIADAMNAMFHKQEPGPVVRQSLGIAFGPVDR